MQPTTNRRVMVAALAATALLAAGCSSDDTTSTATTTTTRVAPYEPKLADVPCTDPLFEPRLPKEHSHFECHTLTLPEDRTTAGGRSVVLPVAILRTTDPAKRPDPYIYISGGPGADGLESGTVLLDAGLVPTDRDFVMFDQRGTGGATPSLMCPGVLENTYARLASTDPPALEDERAKAADEECVAQGRKVADLAQYDTPTIADDVADLRTALGVAEWNVFGLSYGTTVALELMRRHPEGVRSVVLDSVYPPFVHGGDERLVRTVERAFGVLFQGCAKDPKCAAAFPTFEADLHQVVNEMDATPYTLTFQDGSGRSRTVHVNGQDLVQAMFAAMYEPSAIALIPWFIGRLKAHEYSVIDAIGAQQLPKLEGNADGMTFAVECADRQTTSKAADLAALRAAHPLFQEVIAGPSFPTSCKYVDVPPVDEAFHTVGITKIPTLVLASEYDPVTPPADSEETAQRLGSKATFVLVPGVGHGATRGAPCPQRIFFAFLDDPTAKVDTTCIAAMAGPDWTT